MLFYSSLLHEQSCAKNIGKIVQVEKKLQPQVKH